MKVKSWYPDLQAEKKIEEKEKNLQSFDEAFTTLHGSFIEGHRTRKCFSLCDFHFKTTKNEKNGEIRLKKT